MMRTDEEMLYDDELSDDLLTSTESEEGDGELYEHFRVEVDNCLLYTSDAADE